LTSDTFQSQLNSHYLEFLNCTLALLTLFGGLQLLDELNIIYHPTIHRVTKSVSFELKNDLIIPLIILLGCWLFWVLLKKKFSLVLFLLPILIIHYFTNIRVALSVGSLIAVVIGIWFHHQKTSYIKWMLILLSGLEASAIIHWTILNPLSIKGFFESISTLEQDIFYLLAYLSPLLILPLLYVWIVKPINQQILGKQILKIDTDKNTPKKSGTSTLIVLSLILCIVATVFPYIGSINPDNLNIGVDMGFYLRVAELIEDNPQYVFNITRDRPLTYIAIYTFQQILGSTTLTAIRLLPIILNPLLVISTYYLTLEIFKDNRTAAWASFFTASGIQITVGMYSYFLANILGLSLMNFSLFFLFRSLRTNRKWDLTLACIFGSLLLFTHPWTFDQYYAPVILVTAVIGMKYYKIGDNRSDLRKMATYTAFLGLTEVIKGQVLQGFGGLSATTTAMNMMSTLPDFWQHTIFTFRLLFGGYMSNLVILSLAIIGAYFLDHKEKTKQLYLLFLISITSLVFLIGDETIKSRLIFNLPLGILSAHGLNQILHTKIPESLKNTLKTFVILYMIAYLFRSMSNLI